MANQHKRRPSSICWYCANAVPSAKTGCNWSINFEPVDGWDAMMTDDMHRDTMAEDSIAYGKHAFLVRDCPEFIPDSPEFSRLSARYDAGLNALALDVIKIAVIDFIPVYGKYLGTMQRRGYRFVTTGNRLIKMHIPHQEKTHKEVRKEVRAIRTHIYMLNSARKKFPGVPLTLKAISNEVKRLYKSMTELRIPSEDREMSAYGSFKALRNFFESDYAFHLSELDTVVLMKKVMRQVEDEMDIPQMDSIIRPQKRLKKGKLYGRS